MDQHFWAKDYGMRSIGVVSDTKIMDFSRLEKIFSERHVMSLARCNFATVTDISSAMSEFADFKKRNIGQGEYCVPDDRDGDENEDWKDDDCH